MKHKDSMIIDKVVTDEPYSPLFRYPTGKVLGIYGLCGGAIGGLIYYLCLMVFFLVGGSIADQSLLDLIQLLVVFGIYGFILGTIPAFISAIIICKLTFIFDSKMKIVPLFLIGALSTSIGMIWFFLGQNLISLLESLIKFCCVGGISAVITGWIALPKHK